MSFRDSKRYFISGGAGFIGAHLANHLLDTSTARVTVYDNFSNGRRWAFGEHLESNRLTVWEQDVRDEELLQRAMRDHDVVYHLAANADIAAAAENPAVDFDNGTVLTHRMLEAARLNRVPRILYTSGSGVYGEMEPEPAPEEYPRMIPISTYGASKLASESLISAYSHMFDLRGTVFRFANVVGPCQTHGVAYDFMCRLHQDPSALLIYGDGQQSKPYIHIHDILAAFDLIEASQEAPYEVFNVGSEDHLTVHEIADIVCSVMGLNDVEYRFTGGARGWKADVPIYRLDSSRVRGRGWANQRGSREAVTEAVRSMLDDLQAGRLESRT